MRLIDGGPRGWAFTAGFSGLSTGLNIAILLRTANAGQLDPQITLTTGVCLCVWLFSLVRLHESRTKR